MADWHRNRTYPDDTPTKAGISVRITNQKEVSQFLDDAETAVRKFGDDIVAGTGIETRQLATMAEKAAARRTVTGRTLGLGGTWEKRGAKKTESGTMWNSKVGGFTSTTYFSPTNHEPFRMINFAFTNSANNRNNQTRISSGMVTSQMANLFENTAYYTKSSPMWRKPGMAWFHFRPHQERKGGHYFSSIFSSSGDSATNVAITRAEQKFDDRLRKAGYTP